MNKNEKDLIKKTREMEIELFDLWYDNSEVSSDAGEERAKIESPVEKIFYMNFMRMNFMHRSIEGSPVGPVYFGYFVDFHCQQLINRQTGAPYFGVPPKPQKYYVVDFLIEYWRHKNKYNPDEERIIRIAVELDGHDFHEKTKEQAKRDKEKDRFLQSQDYFVARYTGSEIYNNPQKVCLDIEWIFEYTSFKKIR